MSKQTAGRLADMIRGTPADVILKAASICDGHSIFDPQAFLDTGLPAPIVSYLTITHHSESWSPKSMILRDGVPLAAVIRVNRQPAPRDYVLQANDRVSATPTKIEGALRRAA